MAGFNENNITQRRKNRKLYESYCELDELNDSLSSNSSELKAKSLPDLSTSISSDQTLELKQKIDNLQIELDSAHAEIDRLLNDNHSMQNQITDQQNQIDLLKKMCIGSTKKQANSSVLRRRCLQLQTKEVLNDISTPKSRFNLPIDKKFNLSPKKIKNKFEHAQDNNETNNKGKIMTDNTQLLTIIGTQQCKGLSTMILSSRRNTTYWKYNVTSFIKPNALCTNVLTNNVDNKNTNNKLIICVGENDTNPVKILLELSAFLKKYSNMTVIVLSVLNNHHLNVNKLNNQINLICSHYKNATFLNINKYYSIYKPWSNVVRDITTHINRIIDTIDYEHQYICDKKVNLQYKVKQIKQNRSHKINIKNTIPYYYPKVATKVSNIKRYKQSRILDYYKPIKFNINKDKGNSFFR